MARIRTIKPEFYSSPGIETLDFAWRILYVAMWNWADDTGRGTAEARELMGFAFPLDENMDLGEFRQGLGEVRRVFGVKFYKVDGRSYYSIPAWDKHQKIDKRSGSRWPGPDDGEPFDPVTNSAPTLGCQGDSWVYAESPPSIRGDSGAGTGEQGNRGTGEQGFKDMSSPDGDDGAEPAAHTDFAYSADFLLFWDVYPRKGAKRDAFKAWKSARRNAGVREILIGAKRYAEDPNRVSAYTALPATWLNGGRWEDAPLPPRSQRTAAPDHTQRVMDTTRTMLAAEHAKHDQYQIEAPL